MQRTIELHFNKKIIEQVQFKSGFSFETWLVTLEDGSKVVFRTGKDSEILLIDRAMQVYNQPYQIMSYISGDPLDCYLPEVNEVLKNKIYYAIGRITAEINDLEKEQLLRLLGEHKAEKTNSLLHLDKIGRASCRERV